ncbi:MAG: 23S rRNA (guanosine(2251)-2'-O)-methyltransferase RlmB [Hyphomicrobiaceae bacterium]|nr:23S rRNA (guanosine(2251)-2'-O)-methyltransferase RlmB [Hyphomicrobiaceae bacterium]
MSRPTPPTAPSGAPAPRRVTPLPEGRVRLYGVHPVEAALANPARIVHRLLLTENAARRLAKVLSERAIAPEPARPKDLDRMLGADTVHQGAYLETEPLNEPTLAEVARLTTPGRPLIVLDQVTDPHNVGAILRTAAVFGASGLIMTRRHSPPLDGTLAKAASGALELVPIALVVNLSRALDELKDMGVKTVGLDGEATALIEDEPNDRPTALILGAEGRGLRQLTRETADRLCRIRTSGALSSLNVSNAAAVALHVLARPPA